MTEFCETCHGTTLWRGGTCPVCFGTRHMPPPPEAWRPIDTAPRDNTCVELKDDAGETHKGRWTLCDRGWSVMGVYAWSMTPQDFRPTQWRPC